MYTLHQPLGKEDMGILQNELHGNDYDKVSKMVRVAKNEGMQ